MLRSYLRLASLIALLLPVKISAEETSAADNWNILNDLLGQCAQIQNDNTELNLIAQKLWQISEIPYGLRTASSECLNKFFDNDVVYTWDAGWQFLISEDEIKVYPNPIKNLIEDAQKFCSEFEDGNLKIPQSAIRKEDLTGNGLSDYIFSYEKLHCTSGNTIWSGSGGGTIALVVGDHVSKFLARGMQVTRPFGVDYPVILFAVHGTMCDGYGATNCVLATVWGDDRFEFVGR